MNCKQARAQSSLAAGNDLDAPAVTELQRHLAVCPDCRDFSGRMTASMNVLQEFGGEFTYTESSDGDRSLWPRVAEAVSVRQPHQGRNRWFNSSVATLAIAATLMAAVSIFETLNPPEAPDSQVQGGFGGAGYQYNGAVQPPLQLDRPAQESKSKTLEFNEPSGSIDRTPPVRFVGENRGS